MEKKETTSVFLARMEATYGPQPSLEEVYERRLAERAERQAREERRRQRLQRLSLGLLGRGSTCEPG